LRAGRRSFLFPLLALAAILAIYAAVWGHELGHAASAYLIGCKADPWRTGVTPFLWGSRGGAIDETCLARRGPWAVAAVALSGIAVNLLCVAVVCGALRRCRKLWTLVALLLWGLANAGEGFSYLVLNTIWLRSDMAATVGALGGRWIFLGAGITGAAAVAGWLRGPVRTAAQRLASPGLPERFFRLAFALYALAVGVLAAIERVRLG
jgi:hypothetical protein